MTAPQIYSSILPAISGPNLLQDLMIIITKSWTQEDIMGPLADPVLECLNQEHRLSTWSWVWELGSTTQPSSLTQS